jgi:hypothetical protein
MNSKVRPALIGGVALGLLSAIPVVSALNICCCAWVLAGGALAAYLYIKAAPTPVTTADGALVGLLAGGFGAGVFLLIGVPMGLIFGQVFQAIFVKLLANVNPDFAEQMQRSIELQQHMPLSQRLPILLLSYLLNGVVIVVFATIGGLLGVALFEKRKGASNGSIAAPPPPPAGFGTGM